MSARYTGINDILGRSLTVPQQDNLTVAGWMYNFGTITNSGPLFARFANNTGSERSGMYVDATGLAVLVEPTASTGTWSTPSVALTTEKWQYWAFRRNGATVDLLLDGVVVATGTGTPAADTAPLFVFGSTSTEYIDALQGRWRIWEAALTSAELQAERYTQQAVRTVNLWADYPMEATRVSLLTDISGNGRDLSNLIAVVASDLREPPLLMAPQQQLAATSRNRQRLPGNRLSFFYPAKFVAPKVTRTTAGVLVASAAVIAGTATRKALHTTTGSLNSTASTITAEASHQRATSGALIAQPSTIAGVATRLALHITSGNLAAQVSSIASTAAHEHAVAGVLVAQTATILGAASHTTAGASHSTSGALVASSAVTAGSAPHLTLHTSSGAIAAQAAAISGAAAAQFATTGSFIAQPAIINGTALHTTAGVHATSGALLAGNAQLSGAAEHVSITPPLGAGGNGYYRPPGMLHKYKLLEAFKNKQARNEAVAKLPKATEKERVVLRKSAKSLIQTQPVNYKELETRVSADLARIGVIPAPNHLDWLLYFLRVEEFSRQQAIQQAKDDEEIMTVLLMAMME
jgi:Concanavalin A-like lectin/glucanases superfamily